MTELFVGFAALTHLGLVSAAAAAAKGASVVAFDPSSETVANITAGRLPVSEPGLTETIAAHRDRLTFTADPQALGRCDVVYIAPDIPTDDEGNGDLAAIRGLIEKVVPSLRKTATLVILSQVLPGFTREVAWPATQRFYQVETLIFGLAVRRALEPERIVVGTADPVAPLPRAYDDFLRRFGCPILPMRYESAELAKISINMCLVASVSVANTMGELCERLGADWGEIAPALRLDRRIGPHAYLRPGLGLAGGNLERDLAAVIRLAAETGADAGVVRACRAHSRHQRDWALRAFHRHVLARNPQPKIAVLGLAYKENTHSTKNSAALEFIAALQTFEVRAYDPVVPPEAVRHLRLERVPSPLAACEGADAVAVMTPWPEFAQLSAHTIGEKMTGRTLIDPYGLLRSDACAAAGLTHVTLGCPA